MISVADHHRNAVTAEIHIGHRRRLPSEPATTSEWIDRASMLRTAFASRSIRSSTAAVVRLSWMMPMPSPMWMSAVSKSASATAAR